MRPGPVQCFIAAVVGGVAIDGAACLAMLIALRRAGQWRIAEAAVLGLLHVPAFRECWEESDTLARHEGHDGGRLLSALQNICAQRFAALEHLQGAVRLQSSVAVSAECRLECAT